MEGLFFVINQVWILYPNLMGYFILSIILGYSIYRACTRKIDTIISESPIIIAYSPIDPDDSLFIEKTLFEIRKYLSKKYLPEHSWAHTSKDVTEYIRDKTLLELIKNLEYMEYTGISLDNQQSRDINTQLLQLLQ